MKKASIGIFLLVLLVLVSPLICVINAQSVNSNLLKNADFEKGNLDGWDVTGSCSISNGIVHSGSYSAYLSEQSYDSMLNQTLMLPVNDVIYIAGWIYPTRVGNLGHAFSPSAQINFYFKNKLTMEQEFLVGVVWCWNDAHLDDNNTSYLPLLLPFNVTSWNYFSLNLTDAVYSHFKGVDFSNIVLYSISAWYHYSNDNPGAFYVDDLHVSNDPSSISLPPQPIIWSQTYGDTGFQRAFSLVATSDGGYAFAGYTSLGSLAENTECFWLVKTDPFGYMVWNKTYDLGAAFSVIATSDGGFALAGRGGSFWSSVFCLMKTDEFGNLQWNKTYGEGIARSVVSTSEGGYVIAGTIAREAALVKTDAFGNLQWSQTYGGTDDYLGSLIATSDGGFALAGRRGDNSWLVKTDALGNLQWNKTYEETGQGGATALVLAPDGGYTITGYNQTVPEYDYWLVKTDAFGNIQWHKTCGEGQSQALIMASDGGYVIAGGRILAKTDPLGNMEWNQTQFRSGIYSVNSVVAMSDGGYAVAGYVYIQEPLCNKAWLASTAEFGVVPEGLTLGIMLLLSTFVVIVSMRYYRKRTKWQKW